MEMKSGGDSSLSVVTLVRTRHFCLQHKRMFTVVLAVALCIAVVAGLLLVPRKQYHDLLLEPDPSPFTSFVSFEDAMNQSVDPCHDFYSFTCGNWANPRPSMNTVAPFITPVIVLQDEVDEKLEELFEQITVQEDFPQILNNVVLFYKSCTDNTEMDFNHSRALEDVLVFKEIGGWPLLLGDMWNKTAFDWSLASVHLIKMLSIESAFHIQVNTDYTNSTKNILLIKPPVFKEQLGSKFAMIFQYIVNGINPSLTGEHLLNEFLKIIAFEQGIRDLVSAYTILENRKMKILDLQKEIPTVNWLFILQVLTNDTLCPSQCLIEDDDVIVNDIVTLKNIATFIENWNGSKRDVANFFGWRIVANIYYFIPGANKIRGESLGYDSNELNSVAKKVCYNVVKNTFIHALDYLFITHFSYFDIEDSARLVSYSRKALQKLITAADWLSNETKWAALRKLDHMHDVVGYRKFSASKEQLDEIYKKFPIMGNDVIQNYIECQRFFITTTFYRLKLSNNFENYVLPRSIMDVSTYYDIYLNVIVFPLSIQNPPFFDYRSPWYLNFGAIGSLIGHEFSHGFSNIGNGYDIPENLANWWTNKSIEEFSDRLTCFKEQYDQYKFEFDGKIRSVNGLLTSFENMADSSGLRQAYVAYKLWEKEVGRDQLYPSFPQYTQDQMFFISFASIFCSEPNLHINPESVGFTAHSPPRLRVIGSVSNSEDFAKAFNCPVGSPMNSQKKCVFW